MAICCEFGYMPTFAYKAFHVQAANGIMFDMHLTG